MKNRRCKDENQQQTQPIYDGGSGPGTHWWEASALTNAPSLLAKKGKKYEQHSFLKSYKNEIKILVNLGLA